MPVRVTSGDVEVRPGSWSVNMVDIYMGVENGRQSDTFLVGNKSWH